MTLLAAIARPEPAAVLLHAWMREEHTLRRVAEARCRAMAEARLRAQWADVERAEATVTP